MIWDICSPPSTVGNGVAFGSCSTYTFKNGSESSVLCALMSLVRLGRMPIDSSTSAIADEPDFPDVGPLSQVRNDQAASCLALAALALTTVSQEYEMAEDLAPPGPTGTGATATSL